MASRDTVTYFGEDPFFNSTMIIFVGVEPTVFAVWVTASMYFGKDLDIFRQKIEKLGYEIEEELHLNPNSLKKEFSLRDLDGYYLTITEFHEYES